MAVYVCPDASHKDNPVPLAENSEGEYVCVMHHQYSFAAVPGLGRVLCDETSNVFYDLEPFDLSLLTYRGESKFVSKDLRLKLPEENPKTPQVSESPKHPPPPEKPHRGRRISTSSVLAIAEGLDFNAMSLKPDEWKIFAKIDGSACVSDIVAAAKLNEKTAYAILASLIKRHLVEVLTAT